MQLSAIMILPYCGGPPSSNSLAYRWNVDPVLILLLITALVTYIILARRVTTISSGQGFMLYCGWFVSSAALLSPLCPLSVSLFSARVGQHMMLILIGASLIAVRIYLTTPRQLGRMVRANGGSMNSLTSMAGGRCVKFTLVYDGRLSSASNNRRVREKHEVRKVVHRQLAHLRDIRSHIPNIQKVNTATIDLKPLGTIRLLMDMRVCALILFMMTLRELMATFPDETACREYLFNRRWSDGHPRCPRCGKSETVYNINQPWKWECSNKDCRKGHAYRFSSTAGTIFENTKYPLKTWFEVLWQILNSKKGVSALQIQRQIGCKSYQTAWYMCMRLRAAMYDEEFQQLMGMVEVDETYIGGKQENRHWKDRQKYHGGGPAHTGKTTVIGAISRKGNVTCKIIENTSQRMMLQFVRKMVSDKVDLLATDSAANLQALRLTYPHKTVDHRLASMSGA
jgi:hypothetical protein